MHKSSMNKVILIGRLGQDPESRSLPSGDAVANFSLATNEIYNDKTGQQKDITEWHRCVAFGKTADYINNYIRKGRQVYVEGRLKTRKWTDRDNQTRYTTEVNVDIVMLLDRREDGQSGGSDYQSRTQDKTRPGYSSSVDDLNSGSKSGKDYNSASAMDPKPNDDIPF
ncbi:MAG TPA: single-stranded DNA-binding protein [Candidatus Marinimicrobia bacterium]|nr:single-stranded DNA-binding protein [Candidatus Neomarinimicrobiota bacterium]